MKEKMTFWINDSIKKVSDNIEKIINPRQGDLFNKSYKLYEKYEKLNSAHSSYKLSFQKFNFKEEFCDLKESYEKSKYLLLNTGYTNVNPSSYIIKNHDMILTYLNNILNMMDDVLNKWEKEINCAPNVLDHALDKKPKNEKQGDFAKNNLNEIKMNNKDIEDERFSISNHCIVVSITLFVFFMCYVMG